MGGGWILMVISSPVLNALRRSFRSLGMEGAESAQPRWSQIAMEVPSSAGSNDYGWLVALPGMVEWVGERQIKNIEEYSFSIKNKDFEATVGVPRNAIEDDTVGNYAPMFRAFGESVAYSPDELVFALLPSGFTEKAYDGKTFFATDHKVGKGVVSNKGTGKLTAARFEEALATMQKVKKENDQPLRAFMGEGDRAPLLVVGPSMRATAQKIVGSKTSGTNEDNPNYMAAKIMVIPEITDDAWFLLDVSKQVKPFILQRRKQPEFVALDNPDDSNVFHKKQFQYGWDDRKNAGYAFWQFAYGSTGTAA
jgi:phage major head subunit gpT-like protein